MSPLRFLVAHIGALIADHLENNPLFPAGGTRIRSVNLSDLAVSDKSDWSDLCKTKPSISGLVDGV